MMRCEFCAAVPCVRCAEEQREEACAPAKPPQMNNEDIWWTEINHARLNVASGEDVECYSG